MKSKSISDFLFSFLCFFSTNKQSPEPKTKTQQVLHVHAVMQMVHYSMPLNKLYLGAKVVTVSNKLSNYKLKQTHSNKEK